MGVSWEIHGGFKGFYRWWNCLRRFFSWWWVVNVMFISIKSAASQCFDSKKIWWKYEGPGQRNAYFRLLKTGRFPENLSFRPLLNRLSRAPLGCDLRGAACPELPWAKNGKPCIGSSWLLPSNKGGTGRTGRIKRRKVSTRYVGIESIRLFSIYPIYLMLLSQYMVKFGIDGE